ncbi:hypothetical protein [Kitasatospora sp. NPDC094015]|uniref:hypothetical protein n=1 Tax=Kitasatospora sp. NPDC094015 TaxID=3155205 RepID=UPI003317E772
MTGRHGTDAEPAAAVAREMIDAHLTARAEHRRQLAIDTHAPQPQAVLRAVQDRLTRRRENGELPGRTVQDILAAAEQNAAREAVEAEATSAGPAVAEAGRRRLAALREWLGAHGQLPDPATDGD